MVRLLAEEKGNHILADYYAVLEKEYQFWMRGQEEVNEQGSGIEHCVFTPHGIVNRYFDQNNSPRAEMYQTDLEEAQTTAQPPEELFGHLRAACESGWDFSSRWLNDPQDLGSINTLNILPVDLNCLLYGLKKP